MTKDIKLKEDYMMWMAFGTGVLAGFMLLWCLMGVSPRYLMRVGDSKLVVDSEGVYYRLVETSYVYYKGEFKENEKEGYR